MITVGIDEVGRGCWAGPVVAGAAVLNVPIAGLKDSKKLSKKQRELFSAKIMNESPAIGLGWIDAETVDKIGITEAVRLAMQLALDQINLEYDEVIIDGHLNFLPDNPKTKAVIKADDTVPAVSAASIVAKVARDQYMADMDKTFPEYGFKKHVGYGTAQHLAMLKLHGVTKLHRQSFKPIKAML